MTSSPLRPGASLEEELDYYKKQYEQLENDLAEFQASSKDLEEQLERDIETAEKSERKLREQLEKLNFEVETWKSKHKQAKSEANSAQNALQKEITTIREQNRSMQMRLRDIEVVNDDYERQARHTESSLEDMESKHNVAIERGVLLEEEVKVGEQERERLRIDVQRLKDELGDLKVESEVTLEKLRLADTTIERLRSRKPSPLAVESLRARSPTSEASGGTTLSPTASTPPPKSDSASEVATPPSPPLSDVASAANGKPDPITPVPRRQNLAPDSRATPRPRNLVRHSRGPSVASSSSAAISRAGAGTHKAVGHNHVPTTRPSSHTESLPRSESLQQIRTLRGRMQVIEQRVHNARSKLRPPRSSTPAKGSPLGSAAATPHASVHNGPNHIPSSVTLRRSIKRASSHLGPSGDPDGCGNSSTAASDRSQVPVAATPTRRRESGMKRLSYGIPRPTSALSCATAPAAGTTIGHAGDVDEHKDAFHPGRPSSACSTSSGMNQTASTRRSHTSSHSTRTSLHGPLRPSSSLATLTGSANSPPSRTSKTTSFSTSTSHRPSSRTSDVHTVETAAPSTSRRSTLDRNITSTPRPRSSRYSGVASGTTSTWKSRTSTAETENQADCARMPPPPVRKGGMGSGMTTGGVATARERGKGGGNGGSGDVGETF